MLIVSFEDQERFARTFRCNAGFLHTRRLPDIDPRAAPP